MSLYQQLSTVELEIASACRLKNIHPNELDHCWDLFTREEEEEIMVMLQQKADILRRILEEPEENMSNVVFMSKYRKGTNGNSYR